MKKFATILFSLALSVFIYSCGEPSTQEAEKAGAEKSTATPDAAKPTSAAIVNLKTIAGKTQAEVEAILGKAESTEKASPSGTPCKENPCDKAFYQSGKFEIIYINGKADWITINNVADHELNDKNIELLGLPASKPAFNNAASTIRWEAVEGINSVSFFNNGSGKIDYINIKTATK